jgi:1,4-alpha-glucan branching enzyme
MWAHPGKQLLFMGSEIGQTVEWSEARSLDWWLLEYPENQGVQRLVGDLNRAYRDTSALWSQDISPAGFSWIDANDASNNVFSFIRTGKDPADPPLVCIANFAAIPHENYRIGLPVPGTWEEVLNTDADVYSGSGVGNLGKVTAVQEPWHGRPASATVVVPPLGALWLRLKGEPSES